MPRWKLVLVIGALAAALALPFAPAVRAGWLYDDHRLVERNIHVHTLAEWRRWFGHDFWDVDEETLQKGERLVYFRPLVTASYAVDWVASDGSPRWFHAVNLLYQALATALLLVTIRRWSGALAPALAVAAMFAVHPIRVESVAWISGRTDLLCAIFVLAAAAAMADRARHPRRGIALEIAATLGAYACKEQAIVLPLFAAIEAWVRDGRGPLTGAQLRRMVVAALPQAAFALAYLGVRAIWLPIVTGPGSGLPLGEHALLVLETLGRFVALTGAPHALSVQQGLVQWLDGSLVVSWPHVLLGAGTLIGAGAAIWALRSRAPYVAVGLALYLAALVPTLNIIASGMPTMVSERFLYLPLTGIALVGAGLVAACAPAWRRRLYVVVGSVTIAFSMQSLARSVDYVDEQEFWEREAELHPDSTTALLFLVESDLRANKLPAALQRVSNVAATPYTRPARSDVSVAFLVASIVAKITPDRDAATLAQVDRLCEAMLAGQPGALATPGVRFAIDPRFARYEEALAEFRPNFLALRAQLASRRGDDRAAIELVARASERCGTCITVRGPELEILAAADRFDDAHALVARLRSAVVEQELQIPADEVDAAEAAHRAGDRGKQYAALDLWGRAYAAAPTVAEYAFRAGDEAGARRLGATAAQLEAWTAAAGLAP